MKRSAVAVAILFCGARAFAQAAPPAPAVPPPEPEAEPEPINDSDGYTPAVEGAGAPSPLSIDGYIDVGFAKAQGNGTSFAPNDQSIPADYGVDTFAPAVNSRGDVASTNSNGRFVNGFLPRSVGIGGNASFLLNTLDVDLKYTPASAPLMVFSRVQFLPRFTGSGDETRVYVEQAFGRLVPFDSQELALAAGKFDSVFGIEYLDNQANIRTGVTPSLVARYTTGQSIGAKLFYRDPDPAAAVGGQPERLRHQQRQLRRVAAAARRQPDRRAGRRGAARLRAEHAGHPGQAGRLRSLGPRNDQAYQAAHQKAYGFDARVAVAGVYLNAEYVHVDEGEGGPKTTSLGNYPISSTFNARGGYVQLAYALPFSVGVLHKLTIYGRYDRRHAWFEGFTPITVDRFTGGVRLDLWEAIILKAEYLDNRELAGAPTVANNVFTSSLVYSW